MKKKMIRMAAMMLVISLLMTATALADEAGKLMDRLDLSEACALLIDFSYEDVPIADAEFALYRVGEIDKDMKLTLTGGFADYPVEVNGLENEDFVKAANSLAGYATMDGHTPLVTLTTDENGHAQIKKLQSGLYLLTGKPVKTDEGTYVVENQLLFLPFAETTAGPWQYELTITPKAEFTPTTTEPLRVKVIKVWDDKDSGGMYRPNAVTVYLLRDGSKFDTVVLNEENSWRHQWEDLDPAYNWSVSEEVPVSYTVSITLEGTTFVVTNTCKTPPPPTPTPPPIPQTGQLWWPVPVLLMLGVCLVAMGLVWRKDENGS